MQGRKDEEERKLYGRKWIWEGYFSEKNIDKWLETADELKRINEHVLEDVEDAILLETFKGMKQEKVRDFIENDQKERIAYEKTIRGE